MPWKICGDCKDNFYVRPNHIKRGWGKFCSRKCSLLNRPRAGKIILCFICRKETYKEPKALKHSKSGNHFCSKSCQTIWRNSMVFIGPNHPNWKGGSCRNYRVIMSKTGKKKICIRCETKDERVIAVHHIDHNHQNNDSKNLTYLCHNCHFLIHHYNEERQRLMVGVAQQ